MRGGGVKKSAIANPHLSAVSENSRPLIGDRSEAEEVPVVGRGPPRSRGGEGVITKASPVRYPENERTSCDEVVKKHHPKSAVSISHSRNSSRYLRASSELIPNSETSPLIISSSDFCSE